MTKRELRMLYKTMPLYPWFDFYDWYGRMLQFREAVRQRRKRAKIKQATRPHRPA